MKKIILIGVLVFLLSGYASADVLIHQVLYNPLGTESGGEAVQLHNNGENNIDISSWIIATEASSKDAVIPENTILCSDCYYLIADNGWSELKDNLTWPDADYEETMSLYNTDSGIALMNNSKII